MEKDDSDNDEEGNDDTRMPNLQSLPSIISRTTTNRNSCNIRLKLQLRVDGLVIVSFIAEMGSVLLCAS